MMGPATRAIVGCRSRMWRTGSSAALSAAYHASSPRRWLCCALAYSSPSSSDAHGRGAAVLHARYRRQEHADITVSRKVGFLRSRQTRKRSGRGARSNPRPRTPRSSSGRRSPPRRLAARGLAPDEHGLAGLLANPEPARFGHQRAQVGTAVAPRIEIRGRTEDAATDDWRGSPSRRHRSPRSPSR